VQNSQPTFIKQIIYFHFKYFIDKSIELDNRLYPDFRLNLAISFVDIVLVVGEELYRHY
jgi:hypothetical protein